MKTLLPCRLPVIAAVVSALLLAEGAAVRAQTVEFYGAEKRITYVQSSTATPIISTNSLDPSGPYYFSVNINGSNLSGITAPTFTMPDTSGYTLVYKEDENSWGFHGNLPLPHSFSTQGALDTAFPNGNYSVTIDLGGGPSTASLVLSPNSYPGDIPTVTSNHWSAGNYLIDAAVGGLITFNPLTTYASGLGGFIQFNLYDTEGNQIDNVMSIYPQGDLPFTSYTVAPGLLEPDEFYYGELAYGQFTDADDTSIAGSFGYGLFQNDMVFTISTTVPEPGSYAISFGLAGLVAAMMARRRFQG